MRLGNSLNADSDGLYTLNLRHSPISYAKRRNSSNGETITRSVNDEVYAQFFLAAWNIAFSFSEIAFLPLLLKNILFYLTCVSLSLGGSAHLSLLVPIYYFYQTSFSTAAASTFSVNSSMTDNLCNLRPPFYTYLQPIAPFLHSIGHFYPLVNLHAPWTQFASTSFRSSSWLRCGASYDASRRRDRRSHSHTTT